MAVNITADVNITGEINVTGALTGTIAIGGGGGGTDTLAAAFTSQGVGEYEYTGELNQLNIKNFTAATATSIPENFLYANVKIESFSGPEVLTVGKMSFNSCSSLSSVSLPKCTEVGQSAFVDASLTSVDLPELITLGQFAFCNCSTLSSARLPKCTSIAKWTFKDCTSLMDVYLLGDTVTALPTGVNGAFSGSAILTNTDAKVHVRADMVDAYKSDSSWATIKDKIVAYEE